MVLLSKVQVVALYGSYDRQSVSEVLRRVESVVTGMVEYIRDFPNQVIKAGEKHICPECFHYRVCMGRVNRPCIECDCFVPAANVREVGPVQTKGDEIRAMSDEELAVWIARVEWEAGLKMRPLTEYEMRRKWLDWLKSPVEEEPCK